MNTQTMNDFVYKKIFLDDKFLTQLPMYMINSTTRKTVFELVSKLVIVHFFFVHVKWETDCEYACTYIHFVVQNLFYDQSVLHTIIALHAILVIHWFRLPPPLLRRFHAHIFHLTIALWFILIFSITYLCSMNWFFICKIYLTVNKKKPKEVKHIWFSSIVTCNIYVTV